MGLAVGIGLVAGVISGMLGIGGAIVMIPGMVLLLGVSQHTAQGVALLVVVVTATVGTFIHYRQGNVRLEFALWIAPAAVASVLVAGFLADKIPSLWLSRAFGLLLLIIGGRMVIARR